MPDPISQYHLLDKVPLVVLTLDRNQRVTYLNEFGCSMLGRTCDEVLGLNWIDTFTQSDNLKEIKEFYCAIMAGAVAPIEYYEDYLKIKDGGLRLMSWKNKLLKDESGTNLGIISFGEDVTDKKLLRKRLLHQGPFTKMELDRAVESARTSERAEIGYELHDNISQILTTCKLLLEQEIHTGNKSLFLERSFNLLQKAIADVRDISYQLSSEVEGYTDFEQSLRNFIEVVEAATGLHIRLQLEGESILSQCSLAKTSNIFRIIQEAINNAVKHSRATLVTIEVYADNTGIQLVITDNGVGYEPQQVKKGLGLNSIRNRVEILRGSLKVAAAPGAGCSISAHIPLAVHA